MKQNVRCISRWGSMLVVVFCALGVKAEPRAFYQRGKITVAVSNAPLKAVFDAIERQAKVRFMYDMMVVDDKQKVSIQAKEVSLEYILNQLLEGKPLKWSQEKRVIRIDRKSTRLNSSHVKISYAVFC